MKLREHGTVQSVGTGAIIAGALGLAGAGVTALGDKGGKEAHEAIMHYWYLPIALIVAGAIAVIATLRNRE